MSLQTHKGSCHCGKVRFTADLDLDKGTVRCNCSICTKSRTWLIRAEPGTLHIEGEEALTSYTFNAERIQHRFCATCGVKPLAEVAGVGAVVNIVTLDDLTPAQFAALTVNHIDGANDVFDRPPAVVGYL